MTRTRDEWKTRVRAALAASGQGSDEDVVEELAQHARSVYEAARADGEPWEDAIRRVELQLAVWSGDAALLKRRARAAPQIDPPPVPAQSWLCGLAGDVRYAIRLLHRRAAFTLLVVVTMGIGIGGTTTLFSVAYGVLYAPLPWGDAERLAVVKETRGGHPPKFGDLSNFAYLAWREQPSTIEGIAAWRSWTATLSGHGDAERVQIGGVDPELFALLGARPVAGTLLEPADATVGRGHVVVLSESLWRRRFGGAPDAVGRRIDIDGEPHTIVGVLPDRQAYPDRLTRAWIPLSVPQADPTSASMLNAVVKLRRGVSASQAEAEATARGRTGPQPIEMLATALYGGTGPVGISLTPLREAQTADLRRPLLLFLGAVCLLFVTATANVASLLLARAMTRTREMAMRAALGAGGARLTRQLLVESVLLALAGGMAGLGLAWPLHALLPAMLGPDFTAWSTIGMNAPVIAVAAGLSLLAGIVIGVLPALRLCRTNLVDALGQDGAGSVGLSRGSMTTRARTAIMAGQVAIACVLLVGASLLARSFTALLSADRGYDPSHLLTASIPMPSPAFTPERRAQFTSAVIERVDALPNVTAAAYTNSPPWSGGGIAAFTMDGRTVRSESFIVSPGYFEAAGIRVLDGRTFTESDAASERPLLIVNRTFAREYLEGRAAGRHVRIGDAEGASPATEIIGVVEDVRHRPDRTEPEPQQYSVTKSNPAKLPWNGLSMLVRTSGDPVALIPTLRSIIREQHPAAPIDSIMTMEERLRAGLDAPWMTALLIGSFAGVALLIAGVGLFGILSYTVAQRSREIAVRTALGARPGDIVRLVLRQGLAVMAVGTAIGLAAAFALGSTAAWALYGISARDPLTYALVPLLLLVVALAACVVPARRAARMDPLAVLKAE